MSRPCSPLPQSALSVWSEGLQWQPAASPNVAQASKSCGYGTPATTPGGVKCLGPGEYCSHKPGYAAAYRRAGFVCDAEGRLVER